MEREDLVCEVCDSEFSVEHYEEDEVCFCPFCGESLFSEDDETWPDADEDQDEE
jgi:uncharacterized CHY-type Zn-finger protein